MITARLAASYDRTVLALPGRIDDRRSAGCNHLIREQIAEPLTDLDRLAEQLGDDWEILAYGLNGRCIPDLRYEKAYLEQMLENAGPVGLFAVMLGTNDVILTPRPDAGKAVRKMEEFLTWLKGTQPFPILLVAPPAMDRRAADIPEQAAYVRETAALAEQYKELARKQDVLFADADSWRISLAHDAVHFSEAGHRRFADEMQSLLESLHAAGKL